MMNNQANEENVSLQPYSVTAYDSRDLAQLIVHIAIPGLTVERELFGAAKPRPGDSDVAISFTLWGFELNANVTYKGRRVHYHYKGRLPGMIDTEKCFVKYQQDLLKVFLVKQGRTAWIHLLITFGMDEEIYDPIAWKQYEIAIEDGKEEDKTIRLMIIGCYGQGKTTLARRLLNETLEGVESTNGVNISKATYIHGRKIWKRMEVEDVRHEGLRRLALVEEMQNAKKMSGNQAQSELIYSRRQDACETEVTDETEGEAKPTFSHPDAMSLQKHSDLMLFQKIKQNLREKEHEQKQVISLWDFGGQFVFYSTHQIFHSRTAIYLLVFDLHKGLDTQIVDEDYPGGTHPFIKSMKDYIDFWVTSVHSFVGSRDGTQPTIILVGMHKDKLADESEAEEYFEAVKEIFDGRGLRFHIYPECFAISGKDLFDDTINSLRETVMMIGKRTRPYIPAKWIPLEIELRKRESGNILKFEEVIEINKTLGHPVELESEIKAFLKFNHARGTFIYFDEGEMAKYVVINPPYIVDAFRCIITSGRFCKKDQLLRPLWQKLTAQAVLEPELVHAVWESDPGNQFIKFKDVLLSVLQRHHIIAEANKFNEVSQELTPLGFFIVPSFLRNSRESEIEAFLEGRNCTAVSLMYVFEHEAIVPTLFQRVTSAAIGSWSVVDFHQNKLLYEDAGVYRLNLSYAGVLLRVGSTIEIFVVHMCPGNVISAEIPDYFRRFVEYMIRNEFRKLLGDDRDLVITDSFSISLRCYHKNHKNKGSKETYDLEMLKTQKEKEVCCPDNLAHDGINVERLLHEWFSYKIRDKVIPHRRLEPTEFVELSSAIGYEWKLLGALLGIGDIKLQHIEMDNKDQKTSMKIYEMLKEWDRGMGDDATLDTLVEAVDKLPKGAVNLDVIKNLIDKIYQPKSIRHVRMYGSL